MTTQTQREANAAARVIEQHITIAARGTVKSTGQRFFIVNGRSGQYTVLVSADRLQCSCPAGQHGKVCKHRAAVNQALQAERTAASEERYMLAAARRETAPLARSNAPVSIWK